MLIPVPTGAVPADDAPIGEEECARLFRSLEGAAGLVLAVSGGSDSMAMMRLVAHWRGGAARPPVTVATVDHGLRVEAAEEARTVAGWAEAVGLQHRTLVWHGEKPKTRIQETARDARYRLLSGLAGELGASHIVLAHQADDQAETVLFRLLRGSGPGGLAGMPPAQARGGLILARPLLAIPKSRLIATCKAAGQAWLEDPSNAEMRFARPRLRALMPSLAREGLDRAALLRLAERASRAEDALRRSTERALASLLRPKVRHGIAAELTPLAGEPPEIVLRTLSRLVTEVVGDAKPLRLERLEALTSRFIEALRAGVALKSSLGGAVISLNDQGKVVIVKENARRGRNSRAH